MTILLTEEILNNLSVETIVMLIQNNKKGSFNCSKVQKDLFWKVAYEKTQNCIYDTFHKDVLFDEWKTNQWIKEDILAILRTGWVKAVLKYDITKDNTKSCFVPFAQRLMHQDYVNSFGKRHTKEKTGVSVKEVFTNNVTVDGSNDSSNLKNECVNSIEVDENSCRNYHNIELHDMLSQKMNILKRYYPESYEMIIEYIFKERTQDDIAKERGMKQSCVSRHIRKGKNFLKELISEDELYV